MKKSFHVFFLFTLIAFFATMANANQVTLTPDDDGDYVVVPASGTDEFTVPQGVTTFKLYDDGGKAGDCTEDANGTLVLNAPEGSVFELEGSIYVHSYDSLIVVDGLSGTDTLKLWNGYLPHVGPVYSKQSTIVITFKQTGYVALSGFDFTVRVVQVSEHTISVANVSGGTMTPSENSSDPGLPIKLTATPANGYYLSEVVIEGEGNRPVYVEGGKWYTNDTAAFIMPNTNVTVTPVFVYGTPFVNMPTTQSNNITITLPEEVTTFKIYDDGGAVENYSDGVDGAIEMKVPAGYTLQMTGSIDTEEGNDLLTLEVAYSNGFMERWERYWDRVSGENASLTPLETDQPISVRFSSNGSVNKAGIELTATVTPKSSQTVTLANDIAGTVTLNGSPISAGGSVEILQDVVVSLNFTPNSGYILNGVEVVGADGSPVAVTGGEWYSNNTASFTMPGQSVTVTPVFVRKQDVTELSIKVPAMSQNLLEADLLEDWTTYKVYDDGGKNGHASGSGMLALTAPAGKVLQVSGSVTFDGYGSFSIFDGFYDPYGYGETPEVLNYSRGSATIASVTSSGNVITINFMAYVQDGEEPGNNDLDLTVTVMDAPTPNLITLVQAAGGTISASLSEAPLGKTVTITANCNTSYMLESVSVVDAEGNPVEVTGGKWYSDNTASFKMPSTAVTVTPTFTDKKTAEEGLFVNMTAPSDMMPYTMLEVPEGVQSFYVYDDGGRDAPYTVNLQSSIVMYAPSGYVLSVSGSTDLGDDATLSVSTERYYMGAGTTISGTQQSVGPFESEYVMLAFNSENGSEPNTHAGFAFKVTLLKAAITIARDGSGNRVATINGSYEGTSGVNIRYAETVEAVVLDRTFSTAGYSTITLPFAIDVSKVTGLKHAYAFDAMGSNNGKKEVQMAEVSSLEANTPYIIKVNAANLVFDGAVRIEATQDPVVKKGDWEFRGTYQKTVWDANHPDLGSVYGYSAEAAGNVSIGQFVKAAAGAWIRPFRAYLIYNPADGIPEDGSALHKSAGSTLGAAEPLPDYIDVVVVSRDASGQEHKKVIGVIDTRTGEFKMQQDYDLKGRKLMNGQQKARGAYYGKMKVSK